MEEEKLIDSNVPEPKVEFRMFSDRMWLKIVSDDPNVSEPYAIINGYDLSFNFNFKLIKSLEDVEMVIDGIADMFRQKLLAELLGNKSKSQE